MGWIQLIQQMPHRFVDKFCRLFWHHAGQEIHQFCIASNQNPVLVPLNSFDNFLRRKLGRGHFHPFLHLGGIADQGSNTGIGGNIGAYCPGENPHDVHIRTGQF